MHNGNPQRETTIAGSADRWRVAWLLILMLCPGLVGCQSSRWFQPAMAPIPQAFQGVPTSAQLVSAIQRNTSAVQQLNCNVRVVMDGMPTSASGTLLLERPDRLRLKVGVLGMTDSGIDIGSNAERFWIFNKSSFGGAQPTIFYANHAEFANSPLQRSFQLRPQWLFDALGLIDFDPAEQVEGPFQKNGNLELYTTLVTPAGPTHRILTIDPESGLVLQQALYDSQNRLLGWARASKHRYFEEHQVSLPQHIELTTMAPDGQDTRLSVQIQSHTINSLYVDPQVTWTMPRPADVPVVDLTRVDPAVLQQTFAPPAGTVRTPADPRKQPVRLGKLRGFDLFSR
jgi:hypothetical protein